MKRIFDEKKELAALLNKGESQTVVLRLSDRIQEINISPFHIVLDLEFTNRPEEVAKLYDDFLQERKDQGTIKAVYSEMNGFDINTDKWYFDTFGLEKYGGHDDPSYFWLAEWKEENLAKPATLTGLEPLQAIYASEAFYDQNNDCARSYCSLLVAAKFQDLIRRSLGLMKNVDVPLMVSAHDFGPFISEFRT